MDASVVTITAEAGQDLSAKQYYFVSVAADGQVDPTGDGARVDGVLYHPASAAGQPVAMAIAGKARVKAGGNISVGDLVASDTNGKVVTAAQNDEIAGLAMTASTGDGQIIDVLLKLSGRAPKP